MALMNYRVDVFETVRDHHWISLDEIRQDLDRKFVERFRLAHPYAYGWRPGWWARRFPRIAAYFAERVTMRRVEAAIDWWNKRNHGLLYVRDGKYVLAGHLT